MNTYESNNDESNDISWCYKHQYLCINLFSQTQNNLIWYYSKLFFFREEERLGRHLPF